MRTCLSIIYVMPSYPSPEVVSASRPKRRRLAAALCPSSIPIADPPSASCVPSKPWPSWAVSFPFLPSQLAPPLRRPSIALIV